MKTRLAIAWILLFGVLAVSRPILAHHSASSYDVDHPVNVKGIVNNMEWTNPHVFIYLDVKDDNGNVEQWRVEGNSPNMLTRAGWKKEMIKSGDHETASANAVATKRSFTWVRRREVARPRIAGSAETSTILTLSVPRSSCRAATRVRV